MKYVAFIRGIGPGNLNMTNDKLRGVFVSLGFEDVRSVISSGNILFESPDTDVRKLESDIEAALHSQLGIAGRTIVRAQKEVKTFVSRAPFGNLQHGRETYLLVTLLKQQRSNAAVPLPFENDGKSFKVLSFDKDFQALCSVTDTTRVKTPDFMSWVEKQFGKDVTSRTWRTVEKISQQ